MEKLSVEPSAVPVDAVETTLADFSSWLRCGVAGFREPNPASANCIKTENSISIKDKKLAIDHDLSSKTEELSGLLELDEVQAYILLRRWLAELDSDAAAHFIRQSKILQEQAEELAAAYFGERLRLLKGLEKLLWLGEGVAGEGPFLRVIETLLSDLLKQGLEEVTTEALHANFRKSKLQLAGKWQGASMALAGGLGGERIRLDSILELKSQHVQLERCALLNIMLLIYYHPRKLCTPSRFVEFAKLFQQNLFSTAAWATTSEGPGRLTHRLATILLLEALAVDIPLSILADGRIIDESNYAFANSSVGKSIDAELGSWLGSATAAHAPVLLAWAASRCLMEKSGTASDAPWQLMSMKAHEIGGLSAVCSLSSHHGLELYAAEMSSNILLGAVSAILAAFQLSPQLLPVNQTVILADTIGNIFRDVPELCEGFWAADRTLDEPLRSFLREARDIFPAFPTPLYTLLAALSSSADCAASANAFLADLPQLTCLHCLADGGIAEDFNFDQGRVILQHSLSLPGATALNLPQGTTGLSIPLPDGITNSQYMWSMAHEQDIEDIRMIRWNVPLVDGIGQWIVLCRAFEALEVAAAYSTRPESAKSAISELTAALSLLSNVCKRDSSSALELLHVEVPPKLEINSRGPDIVTLTNQALKVLIQLPHPPLDALADCFSIYTALSKGIPGRITNELLRALEWNVNAMEVTMKYPEDSNLKKLLNAECAVGRYPATMSFMRLLLSLCSASDPSPLVQTLLQFVLHSILSSCHNWRFAIAGDRWRVYSMSLRVIRQGLLSGVSEALQSSLKYDVIVSSCLLPCLPPTAQVLENAAGGGMGVSMDEDTVTAAEECCVEWFRLLPVLLPPGAEQAVSPSVFFRASCGREDSCCPAAIFCSYLGYPFFQSSERALVLRSIYCLAVDAASSAPMLPFASLFSSSGDGGASARGCIAAALTIATAETSPQLFNAACDLLMAAIQYHPTLADVLMFPCNLENNGGQSLDQSCLDILWDRIRQFEYLLDSHPVVLVGVLKVLSTLWLMGTSNSRALKLFQSKDLMWKCLQHVICHAAGLGALSLETAESSTLSIISVEICTLQILGIECAAWFMVNTESAMPLPLKSAMESSTRSVDKLLQRFALVLPTNHLLHELHREAQVAINHLLAVTMSDDVIWSSISQGSGLVWRMYTDIAPKLASYPSRGDAVQALASNQVNASTDAVSFFLRQGEVPVQLQNTRAYGKSYIYDTSVLRRKLGSVLLNNLDSVQSVATAMEAVTIAASLEDGRLAAMRALKSFLAAANRLETFKVSQTLSTEQAMASLHSLSQAMEMVAAEMRDGDQPESVAAEVLPIHLDNLVENACIQVLLLDNCYAPDEKLHCTLLEILCHWLPAMRTAGASELVSSLGSSLLLANLAMLGKKKYACSHRLASAGEATLVHLCSLVAEQGSHLVECVSLITALAEAVVPLSVWRPVVQSRINIVNLMDVIAEQMKNGVENALREVECIVLLSMQVANVPEGAALLAEQGLLARLPAMARWTLDPGAGDLMRGSADGATDYSNAYLLDGSVNPVHKLWCAVLALTSIMSTTLQGHQRVEEAALQLAVLAQDRLLIAINPPDATPVQPLTLAMCQETKCALFFIHSLAPSIGRWMVAVPEGILAMRQATAALLNFLSLPNPAFCTPVSGAEKESNSFDKTSSFILDQGWFSICASEADASSFNNFSWQMALELYSCAHYALAFQLKMAPELGEEEAALPSSERPSSEALKSLFMQSVALLHLLLQMERNSLLLKLLRCLIAVMTGSLRLLSMSLGNTKDMEASASSTLERIKVKYQI